MEEGAGEEKSISSAIPEAQSHGPRGLRSVEFKEFQDT